MTNLFARCFYPRSGQESILEVGQRPIDPSGRTILLHVERLRFTQNFSIYLTILARLLIQRTTRPVSGRLIRMLDSGS
jgi:hypothetical protein